MWNLRFAMGAAVGVSNDTLGSLGEEEGLGHNLNGSVALTQ